MTGDANRITSFVQANLSLGLNCIDYGTCWADIASNGHICYSSSNPPSSWSSAESANGNISLYQLSAKSNWYGLGYGNEKRITCTSDGDVAVYNSPVFSGINWLYGYIQFRYANDSKRYELVDRSDDYEVIYTAIYGTGGYVRGSSKTFTIGANEIYVRDDKGNYYIEFDMTDVTINSISYTPSQQYISTVDAPNDQVIGWEDRSARIPSNIYISGNYNNYDTTDMFHRLNYSSFNPLLENKSWVSDISLMFDSCVSPLRVTATLPDLSYTTDFNRMVRLFSQRTRALSYSCSKLSLTPRQVSH